MVSLSEKQLALNLQNRSLLDCAVKWWSDHYVNQFGISLRNSYFGCR